MKVLLILYGHYRSFDKTNSSWIKSLEGCDVDYKFCTFDRIDHNTKCWSRDETSPKPFLTSNQINLLKFFDPTVRIITQEFTKDENNDIYATVPLKVFIYKYNNIKSILESIDETKYDIIIISRYDIFILNIEFKKISILKNQVKLGMRFAPTFFKGIGNTDLFCVFHPSDKNIFYTMPPDIINRKFKIPEECYTEFYYANFKIVNLEWEYNKDFTICR